MPPRPNQARREELLDQLEVIFLDEGFLHLRIGALASRLKCSRSTLYELADSKEALFARVVERYADRAVEEARQRAEDVGGPVRDRLTAFFSVIGGYQARPAPQFWTQVLEHESAAARFSEKRAWGVRVVKEMLDEGIASGELRHVNTEFVSHLLWLFSRSTRDPEVLKAAGITTVEAMSEMTTLLLDGVAHPEWD